jgi:hypothetical protein
MGPGPGAEAERGLRSEGAEDSRGPEVCFVLSVLFPGVLASRGKRNRNPSIHSLNVCLCSRENSNCFAHSLKGNLPRYIEQN